MEQSDQPSPVQERLRRPITEDDVLRADAAMERTCGHRRHAAILMGVTPERLKSILENTDSLREKWTQKQKPINTGFLGEVDRGREPLKAMTREQQAIADAIARQDALVSGSWAKLGYSDDQKEFLQNLQAAYSTNLQGTLNLTYGGMVYSYTKLMFAFEDVLHRIEAIDEDPDKYVREACTQFGVNEVKGPHEFRCELYDRLIAISAELRKVNSDATKANWVRAQIERLKTGANGEGKRKKAGWSARKVTPAAAKQSTETPAPTPAPILIDEDPEPVVEG